LSFIYVGNALAEQNRLTQALAIYHRGVQFEKSNNLHAHLEDLLLYSSRVEDTLQKYSDAAVDLEAVINLRGQRLGFDDESLGPLYRYAARAYDRSGNWEKSKESLSKALKIVDRTPEGHGSDLKILNWSMAKACVKTGDHQRAQQYFEAAFNAAKKINPSSPDLEKISQEMKMNQARFSHHP
jgi:tetratricopeptide (TPR) repeat protein